jgi:fluoride ion exporter CrcB/FEX
VLLVLTGGRIVATAAAAGVISIIAVAVVLLNLDVEVPLPTLAVQMFAAFMLGMALMMFTYLVILGVSRGNR